MLKQNNKVRVSSISLVFLTPTILPKSDPSIIPDEELSFLEYWTKHNKIKKIEDKEIRTT